MMLWLGLAAAGTVLVLVPWVVYPWAMIRLAGASSPAPVVASPPGDWLVSVVLATREPPEAVLARLHDLVQGDWPPDRLELIVAIDGDSAPYEVVGLQPSPRAIRVVSRGNDPGKAAALNAGAAAATGEILVFTDTAQRFAPDAIPHLLRALAGGSYDAISGALQIGNEVSGGGPLARYWRVERRLREAEARLHSAIGVSGSIYAMWRKDWTPLPPGLILDDLWVPMQLVLQGRRVGFEPQAVAIDARTTTAEQEYRRKARTLTGNFQLVAWMPAVLLPWRNPVWLQFWCHKLLRLATPWSGLLLFGGTLGAVTAAWPSAGRTLLLGGLGVALIAVLVPGDSGRKVRGWLWWLAMMTMAVAAAWWNAVRSRWEVW